MPKYQIIKSEYSPYTRKDIVEIEMAATATTSDLPTDISAGSVAYKPGTNGLTVYIFTLEGTWGTI